MRGMNARTLLVLLLAAPSVMRAPVAHATPATTSRSTSTAKWTPVVPFIEDDFGRALALAKERKRPVFIEGWAPW